MGYYSDVAIIVGAKSQEDLLGLLAHHRLTSGVSAELFAEEVKHYDYAVQRLTDFVVHTLVARFTNVKWYESFPDVAFHTALLSAADERGLVTRFVRIGENQDDIEDTAFYPDDTDEAIEMVSGVVGDMIFIRREISMDYPFEATETPLADLLKIDNKPKVITDETQ